MNSFKLRTMKSMEPLVQTLYAFNWIEWIIVPIMLAFMETQPLAGIFALLWLLLVGKSDTSPLTQGSILLLLLSFSWWTLLIKQTKLGGRRKKRTHGLYLLSLFLAVGGVFGTHLSLTTNIDMFLLSLAFIFLLWQQSISRAEQGVHDETLMRSFQISFVLLLVVLLFAIIDRDPRGKAFLFGLLVTAFPIFFLSSLMAFSFVHTTRVKHEYLRTSSVSSRGDPTRTWLLVLVLLWGGIVAVLLMLEALTFQPLVTLLLPLLAPVVHFFQWLVYLFEHRPPPVLVRKLGTIPHGRPDPLPLQQAVPPLGLAVLIIVLALLLLVAIVALLKWYLARQRDPDEVREGISVRSVLHARRQEKRKNRGTIPVLEPLNPSSARAHYRAFLETMSHVGDDMERLPSETPSEYQRRLLLSQEKTVADEFQKDGIPSSSSILSELTQVYSDERYGGMQTSHPQKAYLDAWVPRLRQRFIGRKTRRISRQRIHWGMHKTDKK